MGDLIVIGGGEDTAGEKIILREIASRVGSGPLVIVTVALEATQWAFQRLRESIRELGGETSPGAPHSLANRGDYPRSIGQGQGDLFHRRRPTQADQPVGGHP